MKTITVKIQIQFDQFDDKNSKDYTFKILDAINEVLQREFNDISPIIFTNSIDSSDIEVDSYDIEED